MDIYYSTLTWLLNKCSFVSKQYNNPRLSTLDCRMREELKRISFDRYAIFSGKERKQLLSVCISMRAEFRSFMNEMEEYKSDKLCNNLVCWFDLHFTHLKEMFSGI